MAIVCLQCANENPPDHYYCHQCGSRLEGNANDATPGPTLAFVRRPPDESRLPPPGSFRSGFCRLIRALFVNQKPVVTRPVRIARIAGERGGMSAGTLSSRGRELNATGEQAGSGERPAGTAPAIVAAGSEVPAGPAIVDLNADNVYGPNRASGRPQSRAALSRTAAYWLARAILLRQRLPGREGSPADPGREPDASP